MAAVPFHLPELGENIESAEVSRLLVSEGEVVADGQNIMELESDKASFPLPSPRAGKIVQLHVKEGDTVQVGQVLLDIEPATTEKPSPPKGEPRTGATNAPQPESPQRMQTARKPAGGTGAPRQAAPQKKLPSARQETAAESGRTEPASQVPAERSLPARVEQEQPKKPSTEEGGSGEEQSSVPAGPATRLLARELGVDLHKVEGSAPHGRITREDVKTYVQSRLSAGYEGRGVAGAPASSPLATHHSQLALPPLPDFSRWGPVRRQRQSSLARTAAARLSVAWQQVPHVTQHDLVDFTELEAARRQYNQLHKGSGPGISVTVLCIHAVVVVLKAYPQFNCSLDPASGELIFKDYHNIGVAVDTEQGLLVPVLRDADRKSMIELAGELAELAAKARDRKLTAKEMEGGTFTISNLGGIGGTAFTPIVNYPEVAILGISRAHTLQVIRDGKTVDRLLLPLSLSYDHRVINGADGARFLVKLAELLSGPFPLLAEA
jgi:pyruvate dehydrogenase E2 component (dihydrolipoamide acetyltransferase)